MGQDTGVGTVKQDTGTGHYGTRHRNGALWNKTQERGTVMQDTGTGHCGTRQEWGTTWEGAL